MSLTPEQLRQYPDATEACWDYFDHGIRCLTGFGRGNGYCSDHALAFLQAVRDADEAATEADERS